MTDVTTPKVPGEGKAGQISNGSFNFYPLSDSLYMAERDKLLLEEPLGAVKAVVDYGRRLQERLKK